jgi:ABC-type transporter Mla subunit MlaD
MNTDSEKNAGHYIHRITYNHRERVVGLFVISALVLFLVLVVISGKNQHLFEKRVIFYFDVKSSEGISQGSLVKALGTEIGTVSDLGFRENHKIRVTIEVYQGQRKLIRKGAKAIVNRLANISSASIEIESDSTDATLLPDGAVIPVEETPSINDLLLALANIIQSADNNKLITKFETIVPKLELAVEHVHKIITQIATGHGVLGAAIFDQKVEKELKVVVTSGAEILTEAEGIISVAKKRLVQLEPLLNEARQVAGDVKGASQNLPELVEELNKVIVQANTALTLINEELQNIPGTTLDARRALTKTDKLLDSVQTTWPLSKDIKKPASHSLIPIHPSHD